MTQPNIPTIGAPQAGGGLRLRSFGVGRLVLILPQREVQTTYEAKDGPKAEIVCDVFALDGNPITFGGKANNKGGMESPDTMIVEAPWFATGVVIGGASLLNSLRKALPDPRVGKDGEGVVGRLYQDAQYRDAWKLADPKPEEIARAQQMLTALFTGQYVNPTPRPIAGPQQQQVSYGYGAQQQPPAQPAYGPQGGFTAPVQPQAPAWPQQPSYAPQAAPAAQIPQQYTPQGQQQYAPQPGHNAGQVQQYMSQMPSAPASPAPQSPQPGYAPQAAAPVAPMPVPAGDDVPVPGYEGWWGQMTPEQKAQVRQQAAGAAPTGY